MEMLQKLESRAIEDFVMNRISGARMAPGFQHVDDPQSMRSIVADSLALLAGRLHPMDATKLYRALETDANFYCQKWSRYLELYYYEAELQTIKTLLRRAAKRVPKSLTQEDLPQLLGPCLTGGRAKTLSVPDL